MIGMAIECLERHSAEIYRCTSLKKFVKAIVEGDVTDSPRAIMYRDVSGESSAYGTIFIAVSDSKTFVYEQKCSGIYKIYNSPEGEHSILAEDQLQLINNKIIEFKQTGRYSHSGAGRIPSACHC